MRVLSWVLFVCECMNGVLVAAPVGRYNAEAIYVDRFSDTLTSVATAADGRQIYLLDIVGKKIKSHIS